MMKWQIYIIAAVFLWAVPARAAVIYLNDGRVVKGKIMAEEGYKITVLVNGSPQFFYTNEIERIDTSDEAPPEDSPDAVAVSRTSSGGQADAKTVLIKRLLELNGVREAIGKQFLSIIEQSPEGVQPELSRMLDVDDVINQLLPIYAKHFDQGEIEALISFYTSPAGQKNLNLTPVLMNETMQVMVKYFTDKSRGMTIPARVAPSRPAGLAVGQEQAAPSAK